MSKEKDVVQIKGVVTKMFSTLEYEVEITGGKKVRATISGKMRVHRIKLLPGDQVEVEFSVYDLTNGRIVYRN